MRIAVLMLSMAEFCMSGMQNSVVGLCVVAQQIQITGACPAAALF